MSRTLILIVLALLYVGAASGPAMAQATGLDREHRTSGLIEFGHPFLRLVDNPSASTGALVLAARHAFGSSIAAVADVPISHYDWDEQDLFSGTTQHVSGTAIGNCYFGVEFIAENSPLVVEAGVRPDFDPDLRSSVAGIATDLALWEAFVPATTFRTGFRTHTDLAKPLSCRVRGAVSSITPRYGDSQVYVDGGVTGMQKIGAWVLAPAIDARGILGSDVEDHVVGQVELAAERALAHARPGVFARFYLNSDWHDAVTWTFGLRCSAF